MNGEVERAVQVRCPWPRNINEGTGVFLIDVKRAAVDRSVMGHNFVTVRGNVIGISGVGLNMHACVLGVERLGGHFNTLIGSILPDPPNDVIELFRAWALGSQAARYGDPDASVARSMYGSPEENQRKLEEQLQLLFEAEVARGLVLRADVREVTNRSVKCHRVVTWSRDPVSAGGGGPYR